jgi:hypothetical protein
MFSLNLVLGTFVSRRFMKQLMTGTEVNPESWTQLKGSK